MIRKLSTKKELILDSALRLVAEKNTFDITIREIARQANVNVAAINYYFKSKEQLFYEMEKLFTENFVDAFVPLDDPDLGSEEKLTSWIQKAISYGSHYPGILVLLKDKFINPDANDADMKMKLDFLVRIAEIKALFIDVVKPRPEEAEQLFLAFGAALIFPFVADNYIQGLGQIMSEEEHLNYVKLILNKFKK